MPRTSRRADLRAPAAWLFREHGCSCDVVCATAPASGTSDAASRARGARIIKKVVTQLPEGAKR